MNISDIKAENELEGSLLKINQLLKIPLLNNNLETNTYIVKSGDTLYKIAKEFNNSVEEIIKSNDLQSTLLSIGQILKIPNKETLYYVVKKGDTLYKISRENGVNLNDLIRLNDLKSSNLYVGQKIKIK